MNKQNEKVTLESVRSREIVAEILDFGVSQYQIKKIIKLLSFELEDMSLVKEITSIIDENLNESSRPSSKIEI